MLIRGHISAGSFAPHVPGGWGAIALSVVAIVALSACGERRDRASPFMAAKVNRAEVTVQQVAQVLAQQRGLRSEQAQAMSAVVLERLIDQQLMVQRAEEMKLERDPRVAVQLELARREVLARAYAEKMGEGVPAPTAAEVQAYYAAKPGLFSARRIYHFQEAAVEAKPEQVGALRERLSSAKDMQAFVERLRAEGFRYSLADARRAAEHLPLANLDAYSRMKPGQASLTQLPTGVQVLFLVDVHDAPLSLEQATPTIEQALLNDKRRLLLEADVKALRAGAKIEYAAKFGPPAASGASSSTGATGAATAPGASGASTASSAPAIPSAASGAAPSSVGLPASAAGR